MPEPPFDTATAHRWFAVELNNAAWDLLEKPDRTPEEDDVMLHTAHASCYHWLQTGTAVNHARAMCLLAESHAAAGDGDVALRHARRCVKLTEINAAEMSDFDWAFGYDALARAHAAVGEMDEARQAKEQATEAGAKIADEQDRAIFDTWLAAGRWHGLE